MPFVQPPEHGCLGGDGVLGNRAISRIPTCAIRIFPDSFHRSWSSSIVGHSALSTAVLLCKRSKNKVDMSTEDVAQQPEASLASHMTCLLLFLFR